MEEIKVRESIEDKKRINQLEVEDKFDAMPENV